MKTIKKIKETGIKKENFLSNIKVRIKVMERIKKERKNKKLYFDELLWGIILEELELFRNNIKKGIFDIKGRSDYLNEYKMMCYCRSKTAFYSDIPYFGFTLHFSKDQGQAKKALSWLPKIAKTALLQIILKQISKEFHYLSYIIEKLVLEPKARDIVSIWGVIEPFFILESWYAFQTSCIEADTEDTIEIESQIFKTPVFMRTVFSVIKSLEQDKLI